MLGFTDPFPAPISSIATTLAEAFFVPGAFFVNFAWTFGLVAFDLSAALVI